MGETGTESNQQKISFEQFSKIEIRMAKVLHAEKVAGSDKLLRLEIDLGNEKRQLVAGIAQQYTTEQIIGRQIPVVSNLEPRKIKGIESNGMILAADNNGKPVLMFPEKEVQEGSRVL